MQDKNSINIYELANYLNQKELTHSNVQKLFPSNLSLDFIFNKSGVFGDSLCFMNIINTIIKNNGSDLELQAHKFRKDAESYIVFVVVKMKS